MKRMISAIFALAFVGAAFASSEVSGGYEWFYTINGDVVKITSVSGNPSGDVDIPDKLGGKFVTHIGDYVFQNYPSLTSIGFPSKLQEIGNYAFCYCRNLQEIVLPRTLVKIGGNAFRDCTSLKRVDIFENVTQIGEEAFYRCTGLKYAYLPSWFARPSSELLGSSGAFRGCSQNLYFVFWHKVGTTILDFRVLDGSTIEIGNGYDNAKAIDPTAALSLLQIPAEINGIPVKRIGNYAFDGCSLKNVIVPDGVEYIGTGAFANCSSLQIALMPATVKQFASGAFANCTSMRGARLPIGFVGRDMSGDVFYGCPANMAFSYVAKHNGVSYTLQEVADDHATLSGVDPDPTGRFAVSRVAGYRIKTIGIQTFWQCAGLTEVKLSSSVEEIGEEAFKECTSLETVWIPQSVTYIGNQAFQNCPLKTVYVKTGDTARVKALLQGSGFNVSGVNFVERTDSGDSDDDDEPEYGIDPEAVDPFYPGDMPCYQVINPQDIWDPLSMPSGGSLWGAVYHGCDVVGIIEVKVSKPKKGYYKVSVTMTLLDGKKYSFKSAQAIDAGRKLASYLNIDVKKLGMMSIAIGNMGGRPVFSGALMRKNYHVQTADAAGAWKQATAKAKVLADDVSMFPGSVFTEFLPKGEVASVSGGKWTFKKAASIKLKKGVLTGNTDPAKPNLSGIKLTYKPKTGVFKGSFKVYSDLGGKLKKYTMKVNGVVVGGVGYGEATCKKPAVKWDVRVR